MKIKMLIRDGTPVIQLKYDEASLNVLTEKFKSLGLKEKKTVKGFNRDLKFRYWQEKEKELVLNYLKRNQKGSTLPLKDDINYPLMRDGCFNIALFRVVPTRNVVEIPLKSYLSVLELQRLIGCISDVYSLLIGLVSEATINFKLNKEMVAIQSQ